MGDISKHSEVSLPIGGIKINSGKAPCQVDACLLCIHLEASQGNADVAFSTCGVSHHAVHGTGNPSAQFVDRTKEIDTHRAAHFQLRSVRSRELSTSWFAHEIFFPEGRGHESPVAPDR